MALLLLASLALALAGPDSADAASATTAAASARTRAPAFAIRPTVKLTAHPAVASTSVGLSPAAIRTAYGLPKTGARAQTIAIISAFDAPDIESDLEAYDRRFDLPACTTANGCLDKLNQRGVTAPLPIGDTTGGQWVTESTLGAEVAHGICESCRIMLVEADFATNYDLSQSVASAAAAGATVAVTSYTPPEDPNDPSLAGTYAQAKTAIVSAVGDPTAGDYGYNGNLAFPAALPQTIAAGGTHLSLKAGNVYGSESAWQGTVSGCSLYEAAPAWQARVAPASACWPERADSDLSAVADPGAIIHISGISQGGGPWYVADGTSLSAPIIGAMIGLAGSVGSAEAPMLYSRQATDPSAFHDITSGVNAPGCTSGICKAGPGWDGPTGLGSPAGLEPFLPGGPVVSSKGAKLTISARHNQLTTSRRWTTSLSLSSGNPFRISGSLSVRRSLRIGKRRRVVTFAHRNYTRASLGHGALELTIDKSARAVLKRAHRLTVWIYVGAHGATGGSVVTKKKLTLQAP